MFCRFISAHIRRVTYLFLFFWFTIWYFRFGLIWMNRYIRFSYSSFAFILFPRLLLIAAVVVVVRIKCAKCILDCSWNSILYARIHMQRCACMCFDCCWKKGKPLKTILALIGSATTFKTIPFITFISFRVYTFRARSFVRLFVLFVAFHLVEVTFNVAKETPNLIRNPEMYRR